MLVANNAAEAFAAFQTKKKSGTTQIQVVCALLIAMPNATDILYTFSVHLVVTMKKCEIQLKDKKIHNILHYYTTCETGIQQQQSTFLKAKC